MAVCFFAAGLNVGEWTKADAAVTSRTVSVLGLISSRWKVFSSFRIHFQPNSAHLGGRTSTPILDEYTVQCSEDSHVNSVENTTTCIRLKTRFTIRTRVIKRCPHLRQVLMTRHKRSAWSETAGGSSPSTDVIWSIWLEILSVNGHSWGATRTYHWTSTYFCTFICTNMCSITDPLLPITRTIISECKQWISIPLLHFDRKLLRNKTMSLLLFGHFWKHYFGSEHLMLLPLSRCNIKISPL